MNDKIQKEAITPKDTISTEDFVALVISGCMGETESGHNVSFYMDYALKKGIIEDYDLVNKNKPLERRRAARIIHEALISELAEKDEQDWSTAEYLLDLYSCRTCVMHIAQVYVKGIMSARGDRLFEPESSITRAEAADAIIKMFDKQKRIPKSGIRTNHIKMLSPDEARRLLEYNSRAMLVDVRSYDEYRNGHIAGSRSVPLYDITVNPYMLTDRKDTPIILYCQKRYKSTIAARILINAGYTAVYTIPGIEEYDYRLISVN